MNRQPAFHGKERLLKGALHCHTTRSDGVADPAEVIRLYHANGYDFMALTDHNIYNDRNFAADVPMTIIPGVERDHILPQKGVHVFHTVLLGPGQDQGNGYAHDQRFPRGVPVADQFAFQPLLDDYHAHGNMTMYCHPEWSNTSARDFDRLRGNFAMEIWNTGCAMEFDLDTNAAYWDELLRQGQRIFGAAVDDGHAMDHHCKGWVRVRAENDVASILEALREGAFYSSCGPEIYDFYIEDGIATLECSACAYAGFRWGYMPPRLTHSDTGSVTRATWKVPDDCSYLRGLVKDTQGRRAWTNPIFL